MPPSLISILSFLHKFKMSCDSNETHAKAAMWPFQYFMEDPARAALVHLACATENDDIQNEGNLTAHGQVVNYRLAPSVTDDMIAEAEVETTNFKHTEHMSAVRYSEVLREKNYLLIVSMKKHVSREFLLKYFMSQLNCQWEPIGGT